MLISQKTGTVTDASIMGNILEVEKIKKLWRGSWDSLASHTLYTEIKGLANIELLLRNAIINIVVR